MKGLLTIVLISFEKKLKEKDIKGYWTIKAKAIEAVNNK